MEEESHGWCRFRLRTLLVVVVVLSVSMAWIAYIFNLVRERQAVIRWTYNVPRAIVPTSAAPGIGWLRWAIGDQEFVAIEIPHLNAEQQDRIQQLFPEAEVWTAVFSEASIKDHQGPPHKIRPARPP